MRRALPILALGVACAAIPACAPLAAQTQGASISRGKTIDDRAYALISAYAAALEAATALVRDPATPAGVREGLARAEAIATPLVEALKIAAAAHARTAGDDGAALAKALAEAQAPVAALAMLTAER
jgi:hypothetical protein